MTDKQQLTVYSQYKGTDMTEHQPVIYPQQKTDAVWEYGEHRYRGGGRVFIHYCVSPRERTFPSPDVCSPLQSVSQFLSVSQTGTEIKWWAKVLLDAIISVCNLQNLI